MREEAARRVLLVQAIEQADREGRLLTHDERARATAAARDAGAGHPTALIERRAARLLEVLATRAPWARTVLGATRFPPGIAWALAVFAALVGLGTDALGPERRINILSIPLLGLILWNLGVYAAMAVTALVRAARARPVHSDDGMGRSEAGGWDRLLAAYAEWRAHRRLDARAAAFEIAGPAVATYLIRWRRLVAPLFQARIRVLLHLGAALLALGVLGGAYGRGIAFEYQATWESTFLGARELRVVLVALLGPASILLGLPIPAPEALSTLRAPAAGDAAPWVHRYALTTLVLVVLPRAMLAVFARRRARRLAAELPVNVSAPYFRRLGTFDGCPARVDIVPYGTRLGPREEGMLRRLLQDLVGDSTEIRLQPAAVYGTEPDEALPKEPAPRGRGDEPEWWVTLVFSLAQSPEAEVHGELLRRLVTWVSAAEHGRRRGLVLVDAAPYRARLAGSGAEWQRLGERQRAWDRVAREAGSAVVHLELASATADAATFASLERAVWPPLPAG